MTVLRQLGVQLGRCAIVEAPPTAGVLDPVVFALLNGASPSVPEQFQGTVGMRVSMYFPSAAVKKHEGKIRDCVYIAALDKAPGDKAWHYTILLDDKEEPNVLHDVLAQPFHDDADDSHFFLGDAPVIDGSLDTRRWDMKAKLTAVKNFDIVDDDEENELVGIDVELRNSTFIDEDLRRVKDYENEPLIVFRDVRRLLALCKKGERLPRKEKKRFLEHLFGEGGLDIITMSPPCQKISTVNAKTDRTTTYDDAPILKASIELCVLLRRMHSDCFKGRQPQFVLEEVKSMPHIHAAIAGALGALEPILVNASIVSPTSGDRMWYLSFPPPEKMSLLPPNPTPELGCPSPMHALYRPAAEPLEMMPEKFSPFQLLGYSVEDAVNEIVDVCKLRDITAETFDATFEYQCHPRRPRCSSGAAMNREGKQSFSFTAQECMLLHGWPKGYLPETIELPNGTTHEITKVERQRLVGNTWSITVARQLFRHLVQWVSGGHVCEREREGEKCAFCYSVCCTHNGFHSPPPPSLSLTQWPRETDERVLREWADPNIVAISKILSENAEMKRKRARERHTK